MRVRISKNVVIYYLHIILAHSSGESTRHGTCVGLKSICQYISRQQLLTRVCLDAKEIAGILQGMFQLQSP
jgi:hypothetical protein